MKISELVKQAHANAREKGFWDDWDEAFYAKIGNYKSESEEQLVKIQDSMIASRLALIHSEVSEALEALRKGDMENFAEELSDIMQRVADLAGGLDIDLEGEIEQKMEKNKARGYMHNKKF